jgi:hypothetical protein
MSIRSYIAHLALIIHSTASMSTACRRTRRRRARRALRGRRLGPEFASRVPVINLSPVATEHDHAGQVREVTDDGVVAVPPARPSATPNDAASLGAATTWTGAAGSGIRPLVGPDTRRRSPRRAPPAASTTHRTGGGRGRWSHIHRRRVDRREFPWSRCVH